jgi:hypothetical protein
VRQIETEAERARQVFEKRIKAGAEAKEAAFLDASEAHRVQFYIAILLRVVGPVLLLYGLFVVSRAEGVVMTALAALFLVLSLGLSVWGMILGRRLKRHVDGLFGFFFKEKLQGARSGNGTVGTGTDSSAEIKAGGGSALKLSSGAVAPASRRSGKLPTRRGKAAKPGEPGVAEAVPSSAATVAGAPVAPPARSAAPPPSEPAAQAAVAAAAPGAASSPAAAAARTDAAEGPTGAAAAAPPSSLANASAPAAEPTGTGAGGDAAPATNPATGPSGLERR